MALGGKDGTAAAAADNDDCLIVNDVTLAEPHHDTHVAGTVFTWASICERATAEETGDYCLETAVTNNNRMQPAVATEVSMSEEDGGLFWEPFSS